MEKLSERFTYYCGLLAGFRHKPNVKADDMKHIQKLIDLEEQDLLLKLPCKVGDTVYFISGRVEKQGRRKVVTEFIDKGEVDNITLGSTMVPQITVCNDENIWTTFDGVVDFGKTVFLTQAEAEEALKKMEVRTMDAARRGGCYRQL